VAIPYHNFNPPHNTSRLLDKLTASGSLRLKRWETRNLRRALFGSKGLNDTPRGAGTRTFTLPNGDTLRFDYEPARSEAEIAQIEAEIAQFGDRLFYAELPTARFVTVTLQQAVKATMPGAPGAAA
jgi:hypothetical protein